MNDSGFCQQVRDAGVAEQYLASRLTPAETDAFEAHYVSCERCQLEVRFGAGVRDALTAEEGPERRWRPGRFPTGLAALLAAGVVLAVLVVDRDARSEVERLGVVQQPPIYLGVAVRSEANDGDSAFDAAMRRYGAGEYASAAEGLEAAISAGFEPAPARFFLGSSLLMQGRAREAAGEYRSVIEAGETPYTKEARFYLAKALLQRGDVEGARAQLRALEASLEDIGAAARDLLRSLEEVERR